MLRFFQKYYPIRNFFFVAGEGIFIYLSMFLAVLIIFGRDAFILDEWLPLKILLITLVCQGSLSYNDLYDLRITGRFKELGIRLLRALGIAAIFLAFIYVIFPQVIIATNAFIVSICFVILLIVSWRFLYAIVLKRGLFDQKIMLLGSGAVTADIKREIEDRRDCGYLLALEAPESIDDIDLANPGKAQVICKNNFEGLCEAAQNLGICKIVVGIKQRRNIFPIKELLRCRVEGLDVIDAVDFYENLTGKLAVSAINPSSLIFSGGFQKPPLRRWLKRCIDLVLSFLLLILCLPIIIVTAVLIKIDSKGSIFFSQERVGEKDKLYRIHKFRSMVENAEQNSGPVWAQSEDDRVTRIGRYIRRWRIDELPQLWNVLKGDMSFVGPRPERQFFVKQLEELIPYYSVRFTVKPGITGWAQVCYRYGASVEDAGEKLNYDLFYIKNMTILMDLMIVLRTIKIVLFMKGAR